MDGKSSFDRSLIPPIFIGLFSVVGIVILLLLRNGSRPASPQAATTTPLKFQFIATEPGIVKPTAPLDVSPLPTLSPTAFSLLPNGFASATFVTTLTPTTPSNGLGATNTAPTPTPQSLGRTYDDADFALNYTGNWIGQSGVNGVYQNTLHLSNTIGDAVQLSFVGRKVRITFQAGPSLGAIAIKIDSVDFTLDQSADETRIGEWESPLLILSSHTLTITHISGGSINLDSIVVVDISTATPTITPTIP
jgi:hypothetical protein